MQIKRILEKRKNIIFSVSLLIAGIAIGVGITNYLPLLAGIMNIKPQSQPIKIVDQTEVKKQALAKFYNQISTAQDNQDWASMYELVPQSVRNNLSKEQFISHEESVIGNNKKVYSKSQGKVIDAFVSQNTVVNNIEVNGDNGTVDRTIITCITKECTGDNRKEDNAKKKYVYVDGKWQMPDPKPSDKALEAASYIYMNSSSSDQKTLRDQWGYGSDTASFATTNFAFFFDQNPDKLSLAEAWIDKNKADRSRPVVNYQPPAINYQPPAIIQQPAIQPNYPRNCTSNTIGSYTYTNCY